MKERIKFYFIISICAGLLIFLTCSFLKTCNEKKIDWEKVGVENIGMVYKITAGRSGSNWIRYYVGGKLYESYSDLNGYGITIGDIFTIKYLPEDPSKFTVIDWDPVFTKGENYQETIGKIIRLFRFSFSGKGSQYGIEYEYTVNGITYNRSQHLPPNYKSIHPNLTEGQKYLIWYSTGNPQRSVIYLNKHK